MDLTDIFGNEINVKLAPRSSVRQRVGFVGAHGLTSLHMGTRGWGLVITGTLRASGATYAIARSNLMTAIQAIEAYTYTAAADYTYQGYSYNNIEFEKFTLESNFQWLSSGQVRVSFKCHAKGLL